MCSQWLIGTMIRQGFPSPNPGIEGLTLPVLLEDSGYQVRPGLGFRSEGPGIAAWGEATAPDRLSWFRNHRSDNVFYCMDKHAMLDDNQIGIAFFTLACRVYRITDQASFILDPELKGEIRKSLVRVLSAIIESWETEDGAHSGECLRQAALSLGNLRDRLLNGYQQNLMTFKEFCDIREQCRRLRNQLLDPRLEKMEIVIG